MCYSVTSDVQAISATAVGESTIDIQCWFIHGSDALGCKIVLVSDYPSVNNEQAIFQRSNTSASGQIILTHKVFCYHRVFAFDIEVNNTISNFSIEEIISSTMTDNLCSGNQQRLEHKCVQCCEVTDVCTKGGTLFHILICSLYKLQVLVSFPFQLLYPQLYCHS